MDINKILQGVDCSCGKFHTCDIEAVYIEKGAISRLKSLCAKNNNILVVADENTFGAAGDKVIEALSGKNICKQIFSGKTILIPDEDAIEKVTEKTDGIDLIVGVGSGVIQDLCKYVSFFSKIPYMIVATSPSMDGYASSGAAMILKGMKETVSAGLPRAIIADTEVLKAAPMDMIKAGYGDIIGKYSALCDWKLSAAVNDEYFCQYIYDVIAETVEKSLTIAKGLLARDEESIKIIMEALVIVGIMISFAGSSRPASGSEHHLSHFFEIVGIVNNEDYFPHGTDVAYSTVITAGIREQILQSSFPDKIYRYERDFYESKINEIYKTVAAECIKLQDRIGNYAKDRIEIYKSKEDEIRSILKECPPPAEIEKMLNLCELDMKDFYSFYGDKKIDNAICYAKDLKDRYTVLWLYFDLLGSEFIK